MKHDHQITQERLRSVLRPCIVGLGASWRHVDLPGVCERLGLPNPDVGVSKRERMEASFDSLPDESLEVVAQRFLDQHPPDASERNRLEDLLWADLPPEIPMRYRRELACVLPLDDLFVEAKRFEQLLERLWLLYEVDIFRQGGPDSLLGQIRTNVIQRSGTWSTEDFFDQLGAFDCTDRRFVLFIEGLVSSQVRPDEASQRRFAATVNRVIGQCGAELREVGEQDGYPKFAILPTSKGAKGKPKNLIFASFSKPDIRLGDALVNDVEVASNEDDVLVYDKPIPTDGLRWRDLQAWWGQTKGLEEDEAKVTLYRRLRNALPDSSPPQQFLFDTYHRLYREAVPALPALLPEVWLHWDPKTVKERGRDALLTFRMDFLMLFSHQTRIVIEVDGKQHYAEGDKADPQTYAKTVRGDRDLRLTGYEVYRFAGVELGGESGKVAVREFFERLFKRHGIVAL